MKSHQTGSEPSQPLDSSPEESIQKVQDRINYSNQEPITPVQKVNALASNEKDCPPAPKKRPLKRQYEEITPTTLKFDDAESLNYPLLTESNIRQATTQVSVQNKRQKHEDQQSQLSFEISPFQTQQTLSQSQDHISSQDQYQNKYYPYVSSVAKRTMSAARNQRLNNNSKYNNRLQTIKHFINTPSSQQNQATQSNNLLQVQKNIGQDSNQQHITHMLNSQMHQSKQQPIQQISNSKQIKQQSFQDDKQKQDVNDTVQQNKTKNNSSQNLEQSIWQQSLDSGDLKDIFQQNIDSNQQYISSKAQNSESQQVKEQNDITIKQQVVQQSMSQEIKSDQSILVYQQGLQQDIVVHKQQDQGQQKPIKQYWEQQETLNQSHKSAQHNATNQGEQATDTKQERQWVHGGAVQGLGALDQNGKLDQSPYSTQFYTPHEQGHLITKQQQKLQETDFDKEEYHENEDCKHQQSDTNRPMPQQQGLSKYHKDITVRNLFASPQSSKASATTNFATPNYLQQQLHKLQRSNPKASLTSSYNTTTTLDLSQSKLLQQSVSKPQQMAKMNFCDVQNQDHSSNIKTAYFSVLNNQNLGVSNNQSLGGSKNQSNFTSPDKSERSEFDLQAFLQVQNSRGQNQNKNVQSILSSKRKQKFEDNFNEEVYTQIQRNKKTARKLDL